MKNTKTDSTEKESKTVMLYFTDGYFVYRNDVAGYGCVIEVQCGSVKLQEVHERQAR